MATPVSSTSNAGLISSLGVGSGLNLQGILDQLQASENVQLTMISNRINSYQTQLSAYGTLQSTVQNFVNAATALGKSSAFNAVKSSVTGSDVSITATNGAIAGSYNVTVNQLAQADRIQSSTAIPLATARDSSFGAGGSITITLQNGNTKTINLNGDTSLQGVVNAINLTEDAGVHATTVNDGQGGYYLMITGSQTGAANAIQSITANGNATLAGAIDYTAGSATSPLKLSSQVAQDASLTVNGITVTSANNTIQNVVDNVTFTLNSKTAAGGSNTVNLTSDTSATVTAIQNFVNTYNTLQTTISNLTSFTAGSGGDAGTSSPLTGDSTTRGVQTSLARALQTHTGSGTIQSLADIGITFDPNNGQLDLDTSKLNDALSSHPSEVTALFTDATAGIAASVTTASNSILGAKSSFGTTLSTGSITYATQGLQDTISELQNQYTSTQSRITDEMNNYRARFSALDALVAQMNSTSGYLAQQFASLSGNKG
jgi:flagellar hook-associated protein 2